MTPPDEDFLSRWAARKRAAAEAAPADPPAEPPPDPTAGPEPEDPDPDLLASLPRIEDIGPGTDIRGFLQRGVPRALKNAALRRAWAAHPVISTYEDPARDYFWDYNSPGGAPGSGGTLTVSDALRMAERVLGGAPPLAAAPPPAAPEVEAQPPLPDPDPDPADPVAAAPDPAAPRPRRHGGALPG